MRANAASNPSIQSGEFRRSELIAKTTGAVFAILCFCATFAALAALAVLLIEIWQSGHSGLTKSFLRGNPSSLPERAGIYPGLLGTLWLMGCTALFAIPLGVGAAIYLEEFAPKNRLTAFINLNISNLAGVPSIVYGLLGLTLFVRFFGFGRSILAGALTLSLLIMPVIIAATREALKAVPDSLRHAALGVGGTRWQTVLHHVLPAAAPGMLTGIILAFSRAVGETAPLVMIGAFVHVTSAPAGILDKFTAMPILIYDWAERPQDGFREVAGAGILILLIMLLAMNAIAILLRNRFGKHKLA